MALPSQINSATPLGSDSPALGDDQIRALKLAVEDLLGIPDATNISAAAFSFTASGMKAVIFYDATTTPSTNGHLQRNGNHLYFYANSQAARLVTQANMDDENLILTVETLS